MDTIVVNGKCSLSGEVTVSGAKNSALAIMAATLLAGGTHRIEGLPRLRDITTMSRLLDHLGAEQSSNDVCHINTDNIGCFEAPYELVKTMRASFLVLGPLVARFGRAKVSLPGGCAIGLRPVDIHIKALEAMGVDITIDEGYVYATCGELCGAHIVFDLPTVGGTENSMMAACLARGTTVLDNAACEPEVVDLAGALKTMGARIQGEGTKTIVIEGVRDLSPMNYRVMPDRIEAGTLMVAGAISGGDIKIRNCPVCYMGAVFEKIREAGITVEVTDSTVRVTGSGIIRPIQITTNPYPGFPTDMQAQVMALLSVAQGTSLIRETIFENRFIHVAELDRMGARVKVEHDTAVIEGVPELRGTDVMATDLRASASLILAGLAAGGTTVLSRVYHLDRGYEKLDKKLQSLGADIYRESNK